MPLPTVTVSGSLQYKNGRPVQGLVRFTPNRLWVVTDGTTWACLAPEVYLDPDGSFSVQVTPTDTDVVWWRYKVELPDHRSYEVSVPKSEAGYSLRGLVGEHHSGPRAPH